jgi:hypothetical protein
MQMKKPLPHLIGQGMQMKKLFPHLIGQGMQMKKLLPHLVIGLSLGGISTMSQSAVAAEFSPTVIHSPKMQEVKIKEAAEKIKLTDSVTLNLFSGPKPEVGQILVKNEEYTYWKAKNGKLEKQIEEQEKIIAKYKKEHKTTVETNEKIKKLKKSIKKTNQKILEGLVENAQDNAQNDFANYSALPSSLFSAEEQRTILFKGSAEDASLENRSKFFLFNYGGEGKNQSDNDSLPQGSSYKSHHEGLMMGANLALWKNDIQSFNVSGALSTGDITFTPDTIHDDHSQGIFNSNAVNLMGSWNYEDYYLNLLSGYSSTKGDITSDERGKIASPNINQTFTEITGGKNLRFGAHSLRPYASYRYQQMNVKDFTDISDKQVNYKQPCQAAWTSGLAYDYTMPVNQLGTLHLGTDVNFTIHPSGQGKITSTINPKDAVLAGNKELIDTLHATPLPDTLDKDHVYVSSVHGVGDSMNIQTEAKLELSENITLMTQIDYQQKLQDEGDTDWLFAGGIHFRF